MQDVRDFCDSVQELYDSNGTTEEFAALTGLRRGKWLSTQALQREKRVKLSHAAKDALLKAVPHMKAWARERREVEQRYLMQNVGLLKLAKPPVN